MPSWGVHTALANDLIYRIESKKNISDWIHNGGKGLLFESKKDNLEILIRE